MKRTLLALAVVTVMSTSASATVHNFQVLLDGLQEVPSVNTPGTGIADVAFNDVTGEMSITGTFQDLIGTTTVAHLHGPADFGANAGVIFGLTIDVGVTSGNFSGSDTLDATEIGYVLDGMTYINVHSSHRAGGEIRGQVVVPEPASIAVLAGGGLLMLRRRLDR